MRFPQPKNTHGINLVKFSLPDELLDFQRLVTAAHIGETKQATRPVNIETPVTDVELFRRHKDVIEDFFEWLTDREIRFNFIKVPKTPRQQRLQDTNYDFVSLFSGGIDSASYPLILQNRTKRGLLHHTHTSHRMLGVARKVFKTCIPPGTHRFLVTELNLATATDIPLLHVRGAVFLTNLLCVAKDYNIKKVIVPENGPFMINYPVSTTVSPTRTADPAMIQKWSKIFNEVTNSNIIVETPFLEKTKTDVILESREPKLIKHTWSCSTSQGISNMCGLCMACFVRMLSLYAMKHGEKLSSKYEVNPITIDENKLKQNKKNSFRTLLNCLEFWRNVIHPKLSNTHIEVIQNNNLVKRYPVVKNWALDMYLGIQEMLKIENNYNILGKRAYIYLKTIDKSELKARQKQLDIKIKKFTGN